MRHSDMILEKWQLSASKAHARRHGFVDVENRTNAEVVGQRLAADGGPIP